MGSIAPPQHNDEHKPARRVYLLTSPRTASNLFVRILNADEQPNTVQGSYYGGYFFMPATFERDNAGEWETPFEEIPEEKKKAIEAKYQEGADQLKQLLESAKEQGKTAFIKEHVNLMMHPDLEHELKYGPDAKVPPAPWSIHMDEATDVHTSFNPTLIPDNWLQTFSPTILIRHPALQVPSFYRANLEGRGEIPSSSMYAFDKIFTTLQSSRRLYEFYNSFFRGQDGDPDSPWPLVIDSADFITHPATVMQRFCDLNGFDFSKCKFNWDATSKEVVSKMPKLNARMLSTLNESTGVQSDKAGDDIDIDAEVRKWKREFGEDIARELEKWTRRIMPDYEYLRSKRWNPVGFEEEQMAHQKETKSSDFYDRQVHVRA